MSSTAHRLSGKRWRFASSIPESVARAAPFAAFIALLAADPLLAGAVDARWLTVARALAAAALLAFFWPRYVELTAAPSAPARDYALAVAMGLGVAALWITLDASWAVMGATAEPFVPLRPDGALDPQLLALRLAGFVLVVPLMEELFWRSFLMRWIAARDFLRVDPRAVGAVPWAVSALLFALEHHAWAAGLVAGLAFGKVYRHTGNLRTAVASHSISNAALGGWILATHDWTLW
jgi:CAAX prenyl protease-like protein